MIDKTQKIWVSHSSINDFLNCPRLYYLRAVYKDPITGHKITRVEPPLALGGLIHDLIESISTLPTEERFLVPLSKRYNDMWEKISGKLGGFKTKEEEDDFFQRGLSMVQRIENNPGPIAKKAIKLKEELPQYYLSESEGIILCGKIDWIEYIPERDSIHIVDFKAGKNEEREDSLQLPIYYLIVTKTQARVVEKTSYWYLYKSDTPQETSLPNPEETTKKVYDIAKRMKLARQLEHFKCPQNGCRYCIPLEEIVKGKGERVGVSNYNQDIYFL